MQFSSPPYWNSGSLEVICGSMFSGKTEELIQRIERARIAKWPTQVFKPSLDTRGRKEAVNSHSERHIAATPLATSIHVLDHLHDTTRIVAFDEAQFFDSGIVDVCQRLANRGLRVIIAGLDLDYRGQPFGPMPHLMALAESVTKMNAICTKCGRLASRTQRLAQESGQISSEQVLVGAEALYEARCRFCFEAPPKPTDESTP